MKATYFEDTDALTVISREGERAAYTVPLGDDGVVQLVEARTLRGGR